MRFVAILALPCCILLASCGDGAGAEDKKSGDRAAGGTALDATKQGAYVTGYAESFASAYLQQLLQDNSDAICVEAGKADCGTVSKQEVRATSEYKSFLACAKDQVAEADTVPEREWKTAAQTTIEACESLLVSFP